MTDADICRTCHAFNNAILCRKEKNCKLEQEKGK